MTGSFTRSTCKLKKHYESAPIGDEFFFKSSFELSKRSSSEPFSGKR